MSQRTKRSTAAAGGSIIASHQSPTLKIHLPIKIKLEQDENSQPTSPVQTTPARSASTPPPPPARTGSPSTQPTDPQQQHNFLQISRPILPATPALLAQAISTPQITSPQQQSPTAQKKKQEPRARQMKKYTTVETRAVVAAKKVKQQHTPSITSPHTPGLAASRTKRAVNKDKLRTISKNVRRKWVPSSVPGTNNKEMTKFSVKSKRGRKRRDKRLSEGQVVPLSPYQTILPGDKLRVYYGPTLVSTVTYEAKVLSVRMEGSEPVYLVHYTGWNNRYDEWINTSRIADNLSWIPGRTARKAYQISKAPKRNQQPLMTPTPTSSSASSTSSNSSTTLSKSNVTLMSSGCRKTSTRASTRAAAIRKEISNIESNTTEYDSVAIIEPEMSKISLMDSKSNNESNKKSFGKKRKFEEISKSDANLPIKLEIEDCDEESMHHSRNVDNDENSEEHDLKILKSDAIKTVAVSENDSYNNYSKGGNNLGNVIIVDVELKNESEEDSLVIDENQEIDESEVIEGYSSVATTDSKPDSKLHPTHQPGRDFDLTQIRSELKGFEFKGTSLNDIEDLNLEESNTSIKYEFKEPEFDTTTTCKMEPLRATTERPPAGFLFMDEHQDEEDVCDDDDNQDRLIVSDSNNEIPAEMSIDLPPLDLSEHSTDSAELLTQDEEMICEHEVVSQSEEDDDLITVEDLDSSQCDITSSQGDLVSSQGDITSSQGDLASSQSDLACAGGGSSSGGGSARGPHTPPGLAPGTPPDTNEVVPDQVSPGTNDEEESMNKVTISKELQDSMADKDIVREAIRSPQNEVTQPQASGSNEQYQGLFPAVEASTSHEIPKRTVIESIRTRKNDTRKYRSRHHAPEMDHQQRVNHIQNAMRDIRKAYASLKLGLVLIKRRRKKLRRRERESM